jgi:Raf kinase inhibitor-like YbhB/YbcL family protein
MPTHRCGFVARGGLVSRKKRNDYGVTGFCGACPPPGKPHRYVTTVYALGVEKIAVDSNMTPAVVGFMTLANTIGKASVTAL